MYIMGGLDTACWVSANSATIVQILHHKYNACPSDENKSEMLKNIYFKSLDATRRRNSAELTSEKCMYRVEQRHHSSIKTCIYSHSKKDLVKRSSPLVVECTPVQTPIV